MTRDNTESKSKASEELQFAVVAFVVCIIFLPFTIAFIIAKWLNKIYILEKPLLKKMGIISIILGFMFLYLIIIFIFKAYRHSDLDVWEYFFPISGLIKSLIHIRNHIDWVATSLTLFASTFFIAFLISIIFWLIRKPAINHYKNEIDYYLRKLEKEEIVTDPRINLSMFKIIQFWLLSIDSKDKFKEKINPKERVMLDKEYGIPLDKLGRHLAIMGTTGAGKTKTLYKFLDSAMEQEKGIIFVDGKGDEEDLFKIRELAKINKRKFYAFTIDGSTLTNENYEGDIKTTAYNPFSTPKKGILTDMIMSCFDFSEEHYKAAARTFFEILIETLLALDTAVSWDSILYNLELDKLTVLLQRRYKIGRFAENNTTPKNDMQGEVTINAIKKKASEEEKQNQREYNIALTQINNVDKKGITGFSSRLGMIHLTTKDTIKSDGITLKKIFEEEAIIYFSLNSTDYAEAGPMLGKLIVNDIKASAEINASLNKKTVIALDEFNVFANDNVIDILNKGRSKGYEVILAFQSLADLSKVSVDFMKQVIENTNNKILHQTNDPDGAEYMAKVMGTFKEEKKTYAIGDEEKTGGESWRIVDSFIAHPNKVKTLSRGSAFVKYLDKNNKPYVVPHEIKIHVPKRILDL